MRWERHGSPSSHWTIELSRRWFYIGLLFLTAFHFWLAFVLPPTDDELYYWTWSQHLGPSYFDHPPLVAYLIRLGTSLFGNNIFGIRFFASVFGSLTLLIGSFFVQTHGILALVLLTPIFFFGTVLMTPDLPLILFWSLYILWLLGVNKTLMEWSGDPVMRVYHKSPVSHLRWAFGGVILGLGLLSKYPMLIAAFCTLGLLVVQHRGKAWFSGFFLHMLVAGLMFSPVLFFNWETGFASFHFQWQHSMGDAGFTLARAWEFFSTQSLLVSALPFLMLPWVLLISAELLAEVRAAVFYAFFVPPILFFMFQASRHPFEANWAFLCYVAAWPLAQRLLDHSTFKFAWRLVITLGFLPALGTTVFLIVHLVRPMVVPAKDRLAFVSETFKLAKQIGLDIRSASGQAPIFTPNYQWTSQLRYQGVPAEQLWPAARASQFTLKPVDVCASQEAIVLLPKNFDPPVLKCFNRWESLQEYSVVVRGETRDSYSLRRYVR